MTTRFTGNIFVAAMAFVMAVTLSLSAKPAHYLALTGGTNGLGLEYSFCLKRISIDFGIPLYCRINEYNSGDTVVNSILFSSPTYFSFNAVIFEQRRFQMSIGIAMFNEIGFQSIHRAAEGPADEDTLNNAFLDTKFGPIAEYVRRDEEFRRIFSVQLAPVKLPFDDMTRFDFRFGVQLNYYLKRYGE